MIHNLGHEVMTHDSSIYPVKECYAYNIIPSVDKLFPGCMKSKILKILSCEILHGQMTHTSD